MNSARGRWIAFVIEFAFCLCRHLMDNYLTADVPFHQPAANPGPAEADGKTGFPLLGRR